MSKHAHSLPVGTHLENYVIERVLGVGGFSVVYLAGDQASKLKVVIKEYMPKRLATRGAHGTVTPRTKQDADLFVQGRRLFLQEATALAKLRHPNIVHVFNFFQAHDTVYLVMAYEEGVNLGTYVQTHNGSLSERLIRTVFPGLLKALQVLHSKGLLHLDIKPNNIHLCQGGRPLLLDFGAVHQRRLSRKHQQHQVVTPGFSPIEQYKPSGYMGPWTDIYAIGATMRTCIEGKQPPAAIERLEKDALVPAATAFKRRYSKSLLEAIDWAMEVDPLLRPQSVDELLAALEAEEASKETLLNQLSQNIGWLKSNL